MALSFVVSAANHAAVMDDQSGDWNVAVRRRQGGLLDRLADPSFIVYAAFLIHVAVIMPYQRKNTVTFVVLLCSN